MMVLNSRNPRFDLIALWVKIFTIIGAIFYLCSCSRNVTKNIQKTDSTAVHQVVKVLDSSKAAVQVKKRNNTTHFAKRTTTVTTPILIEVDSVSQYSDHTAEDYLPEIHKKGKTYVVVNKTKKVEVYTGGAHSVTTDSNSQFANHHQAETIKDSTHLTKIDKSKNVKSHPSIWWWLLLIPAFYIARKYWFKIRENIFA
jgi:hypothetical protein